MPWWLRGTSYLLPWRWVRGGAARCRGRAPAPGAGRAGADLHQVRADSLDLSRPAAAGYRRRTGDAAGPSTFRLGRRHMIEQQLHAPVGELFARFDSKPLASASVAQVHAAKLRSGEEVVVRWYGRTSSRSSARTWPGCSCWPIPPNASPSTRAACLVEVVDDYAKTIYDELDLLREAATPASSGATSKARHCSTCRRCTGTIAGRKCSSWSASMAYR